MNIQSSTTYYPRLPRSGVSGSSAVDRVKALEGVSWAQDGSRQPAYRPVFHGDGARARIRIDGGLDWSAQQALRAYSGLQEITGEYSQELLSAIDVYV